MKKTSKIALGGVMASLSVVMMMLTGIFPMADFSLPALAGVFLIPIVLETGRKSAWTVYAAVSILSFFVSPSKECVLFYVALFGYYPILKSSLERIKSRVLEWVCKLLVVNAAAVVVLAGALFLLKLPDYQEMLSQGIWLVALGWLIVNLTFVLYDIVLTQLVTLYLKWFRPKYLAKILK